MLRLVPGFLLVLLSVAGIAHAATIGRVDVLDSGTYRVETGDSTAEANTPTGEVTSVGKAALIEATDTIIGAVGTEFGFRYRVVGEPEGEAVDLDIVITFPDAGLTDPESGKTIRESRYSTSKKVGADEYLGYGFEADWEIVPGAWSFEIWHDGHQMARLVFNVTQ